MATIIEMRDAIEEKIRDLILADTGALTELRAAIRGYTFNPKLGDYPLVELFTEKQEHTTEETGLLAFNYLLHLGVSVLLPDHVNVGADRRGDVPSYTACGRYVAALRALLLRHRSLDDLGFTDADGNVERAWYLELREDYAGVEERRNNYSNFGRLSYTVHTRQTRYGG